MSELLSLELAFLLGLVVWTFSTVVGGGGPLLFLPSIAFLVPVKEVAPITSVTAGIVSVHRVFLFWRHIDFKVLAFLLPGSALGTIIGVQIFAILHAEWIALLLGLFLVVSGVRPFLPLPERRVTSRDWYFFAAGAVFGGLSAVVGAAGQGINVLMLNRGITKERLIATKAVDATLVQAIKIIGYVYIAGIGEHVLLFGAAAGAGAMVGNLLGKRILGRMSVDRFFYLASAIIALSGLLVLLHYAGWGS